MNFSALQVGQDLLTGNAFVLSSKVLNKYPSKAELTEVSLSGLTRGTAGHLEGPLFYAVATLGTKLRFNWCCKLDVGREAGFHQHREAGEAAAQDLETTCVF